MIPRTITPTEHRENLAARRYADYSAYSLIRELTEAAKRAEYHHNRGDADYAIVWNCMVEEIEQELDRRLSDDD